MLARSLHAVRRRGERDGITVRANVPDRVLAAAYAAARVAVVPLRCGAGVKLKVVEALHEGVPLVIAAGTGVLNNDTDVDSTSLHAVLVNGPTHGALTINADGSFTYTPNPGYHGDDSFTYTLSDGLLTHRDRNAASGATVQIEKADVRARAASRRRRDQRRANT